MVLMHSTASAWEFADATLQADVETWSSDNRWRRADMNGNGVVETTEQYESTTVLGQLYGSICPRQESLFSPDRQLHRYSVFRGPVTIVTTVTNQAGSAMAFKTYSAGVSALARNAWQNARVSRRLEFTTGRQEDSPLASQTLEVDYGLEFLASPSEYAFSLFGPPGTYYLSKTSNSVQNFGPFFGGTWTAMAGDWRSQFYGGARMGLLWSQGITFQRFESSGNRFLANSSDERYDKDSRLEAAPNFELGASLSYAISPGASVYWRYDTMQSVGWYTTSPSAFDFFGASRSQEHLEVWGASSISTGIEWQY
jgi:hypothetical protein